VLHIMATVQLHNRTEGRAYFDRKKASGKVNRPAAGHGPQPRSRPLRDPVDRPLLPRGQQRVLDDLFGHVEVAQDTHHGRGEAAGLLPEHGRQRVAGSG
jgi:hypothetical protein